MIKIRTDFLLTQSCIRLSHRLDIESNSLTSKLLGLVSDDNSRLTELKKGQVRWVVTHPDSTSNDISDYVEYVLERRKDLLKENEWGNFFKLISCEIEIDNQVFHHSMDLISGNWKML